jgi:hypothetical protein
MILDFGGNVKKKNVMDNPRSMSVICSNAREVTRYRVPCLMKIGTPLDDREYLESKMAGA